jgi:ElaB/YqjD/DUF883 family membrane-anchored ribosome-binding protein
MARIPQHEIEEGEESGALAEARGVKLRRRAHLARELDELRAENARLRTALVLIEEYKTAAKSGSDAVDDSPWYALGRIAAQASFALRGHGDGPTQPDLGNVTNEEERDGTRGG